MQPLITELKCVIQRQIRLIESTDKRYFKNDRYNKTKTSNQTVEQAIDFG